MIVECESCRARTMRRRVAGGKVFFTCPSCDATVERGGEARLMSSGGVTHAAGREKYQTFLRVAAFSPANLRVARECEGCGLPYMTLVRVGEEETVFFVCTCGRRDAQQ